MMYVLDRHGKYFGVAPGAGSWEPRFPQIRSASASESSSWTSCPSLWTDDSRTQITAWDPALTGKALTARGNRSSRSSSPREPADVRQNWARNSTGVSYVPPRQAARYRTSILDVGLDFFQRWACALPRAPDRDPIEAHHRPARPQRPRRRTKRQQILRCCLIGPGRELRRLFHGHDTAPNQRPAPRFARSCFRSS